MLMKIDSIADVFWVESFELRRTTNFHQLFQEICSWKNLEMISIQIYIQFFPNRYHWKHKN